jgi:hypothetical protein
MHGSLEPASGNILNNNERKLLHVFYLFIYFVNLSVTTPVHIIGLVIIAIIDHFNLVSRFTPLLTSDLLLCGLSTANLYAFQSLSLCSAYLIS